MSIKFTQKEVEIQVAEILENGDITSLSHLSGIGYSYIDQQLNPNDERQSFIYGFLRIQCAFDALSAERGEMLWQLVKKIREASKPIQNCELSPVAELVKAGKEFADVWEARLQGKTGLEQIGEINESIAQLQQLKKAILNEINLEKDSFDSDRSRFKAVK